MFEVCHIYDDRAIFFDHIASWRLRIDIPRKSLSKMGIVSYCERMPNQKAINVFHKHQLSNGVEWIKQYGGIVDVTDDHFNEESGDYYRSMVDHATKVTCPTEAMKRRIWNETGRDAEVVKDPYDSIQYVMGEPEYKNTRSVCWFGSETNLIWLKDFKLPCKGDLITHRAVQNEKDLYDVLKNGWNYIPWVNKIMPNIFKRHDIVILPYGDTPKQQAKSPNRVVDSIRSGKIVVTNDNPVIDSYGLRDFVVVNDDLTEGIEYVWENPEIALSKVKKGQDFIEKTLNSDVIASQWASVIKG